MRSIQTDTSNEALLAATRANILDLFRFFGNGTQQHEAGGFKRWLTSVKHPWFNGVIASQPPADGDEALIRETCEYFRANGADSFTWWVEPQHAVSAWEPVLTQHGFRFSNDTPGMAVDLEQLNETAPPVDGLEIQVVSDEAAMRLWAQTFINGYHLPAEWEDSIFELWLSFGLDFPMRSYLGYLNGVPVSTATLFFGGGAAGIYSVATLPAARGKGIGAALTLQPLLDAREMGYRIGTLQSSEMGFEIYKKLGFRHLCQIEYFHISTRQSAAGRS
jgi:ribosomal protein S18 acetylase RimI-like enzyme